VECHTLRQSKARGTEFSTAVAGVTVKVEQNINRGVNFWSGVWRAGAAADLGLICKFMFESKRWSESIQIVLSLSFCPSFVSGKFDGFENVQRTKDGGKRTNLCSKRFFLIFGSDFNFTHRRGSAGNLPSGQPFAASGARKRRIHLKR